MKKEKIIKDEVIRMRVTKQEKEAIESFCKEHEITMSEFLRSAAIARINRIY